ncbi:2-aminoadipate transaminase [Orbus hercynius]|uniref:2-aminoadipate transaminase n=1 Tax=Orbus hercynius TaxID=593135 RepID=A0A495RCA3_9GAMM|nr:PLP-dependent aminotransferase family protein [Orbus hercynius]RKS85107.1 2-aminoadipate transaminase [Orbus hercynius]
MSSDIWQFSQRAAALQSSAIREILKVTELPNVISFAGGLPSPNTFPIEKIKHAVDIIMDSDEAFSALQYGPTEGYTPLREWVKNQINQRENTHYTTDNVLIVTGSQQALDLIGKALIDNGTKVLVETPTYLGGLQTFTQYAPHYVSIASDEQGLDPDKLSDDDAKAANFLYTIPNFQNPTGRRLSAERRKKLAQKAIKNNLLMIEDDPYGELDYQGHRLPSLISFAPENTVYLGSFSKILAPGMRLGYVVGPESFIRKLVQLKQAADLHTPSYTQHIAYQVVKEGYLASHIPTIRELYKTRCEFMLTQLEKYMPKTVRWTKPEGGMFIWVELPEHIDTTVLLAEAIKHNVAFVPGETFFATNPKRNCLRLAFVTVPEERIEKGIQILADLIK